MKKSKQECPVCFETIKLIEHCEECKWKCCKECNNKWLEDVNTCMICRKELYDKDDEYNVDVAQAARLRCYWIGLAIINGSSACMIFSIIMFCMTLLDFETDGYEEEIVLGMFVLFVFVVAIRTICISIAKKCCIENVFNLAFSHEEFEELDETV